MKKIINKFCKQFGVSAHKGKDWHAYPNKIYYPKSEKKYNSVGFMELINAHYPDVRASEFTWSLLHEIGHAQTWNEFTKKEWKQYAKKAPHTHDLEEYYQIPQEKRATDWAYSYIKAHPKKIAKFEKKIQKALSDAYTLYETT